MEFTFKNKKGEIEKVKPEKLGWAVLYKDGTELHQFGPKGDFHQIGEVEKDKVKLFVVYDMASATQSLLHLKQIRVLEEKLKKDQENLNLKNDKKHEIVEWIKCRGKRIEIVLPAGAKLIYRYDNYKLNVGTKNARDVRVYVFGYKKGAYFLNYILPDGRVIQTDNPELDLTKFNI